MPTIRKATAADFRAFYSIDPPPIWLGLVAEERGALIGIGTVVWNNDGQAIGFYACKGRLPATLIHRTAKRVIGILKQVGEPALYAVPDHVPRAEEWMRRLGFKPLPENPKFWRLDLAWTP